MEILGCIFLVVLFIAGGTILSSYNVEEEPFLVSFALVAVACACIAIGAFVFRSPNGDVIKEWSHKAEKVVQVHLKALEEVCPNGEAHAWAEINTHKKSGYEVIGECV